MNLVLGFGLKYLWNMVNLLQFVVFMRIWFILIPVKTDVFLQALKSLALFEFLSTDQISQYMHEWFGVEKEEEDYEEKSIFDELFFVVLASSVVCLLFVILVLLCLCSRACDKCKACVQRLKQKLLYGTIIRYVLLSSLKTQMTMCAGLAVGRIIAPTPKQPAKDGSFVYTAVTMLTILNVAPFVFACALWRNRRKLKEPEVK